MPVFEYRDAYATLDFGDRLWPKKFTDIPRKLIDAMNATLELGQIMFPLQLLPSGRKDLVGKLWVNPNNVAITLDVDWGDVGKWVVRNCKDDRDLAFEVLMEIFDDIYSPHGILGGHWGSHYALLADRPLPKAFDLIAGAVNYLDEMDRNRRLLIEKRFDNAYRTTLEKARRC